MEGSEKAIFPAAEREVSHGGGDTDVDSDVTGGGFVTEAAGGDSAGGEDTSGVAVGASGDHGDGFVKIAGADEREHRAEDFGAAEFAIEGGIIEDGGIEEVATAGIGGASVEDCDCAFGDTAIDTGFDAGFALGGDDGPHLGGGVEAGSGLDGGGGLGDGVAERDVGIADGDGHGDGETALAGATESAVADDFGGHGEVGIRHDDNVVFGATLALNTFSIGGGASVDGARGGCGSNETDGADVGVIDDGIGDVTSAVDEVADAGRESGLVDEFEDPLHGEWDAFARFDDEGVAASDGVGEEPERDHAGEVEGGDCGDDTEGLADHDFVDAGGDIFEVVALHESGDAAGDFDVFDTSGEFGGGFGEGFAVFLHEDAGDGIGVFEEEGAETKKILDAFLGRGAAPGGEGGGRGLDDGCGVGGGAGWEVG